MWHGLNRLAGGQNVTFETISMHVFDQEELEVEIDI
jgi:hypothetical protein